ncbi:MAG: hypothetical protein NC132_01825 [Corallococcus sp.]|nr:hypothetical protein [Corallococcus sp.]MCM1359397.1 hypothetical protein [Corallococcus sp.]MCM1394840.1 hypothetical protein [Corallococcus sp.]
MDYEGVNSVVCDAEESDWLDISYTERKYIDKPKTARFRLPKIKIKKVWTYAAIALVCVAVLATMLFVDGNFTNDVFNAVKTASTSVFNRPQDVTENKINIPCNVTLVEVKDGVMTFSGGRAALSLTAGKVTEISENSVTVAVDEDTQITYSQLDSVYVAVGDEIAETTLLGKYSDNYSASIYEKGEIVKQVVGSESQLKWSV